MTDKIKVYVNPNCVLRIPGHGEFTAQDMRFDPEAHKLHIRTPEGMVAFGVEDTFPVGILDLELPTYIRKQMKNEGWETMAMAQVIRTILLNFLSEN